MNILMYLFRQSWRPLALVILCSTVAGLSGAALMAMIGKAIAGKPFPHMTLAFFGACIAMMLSRTMSELIMVRVSQAHIMRLRVGLSQKMLTTPVKQLQEMGKNGLLVILTRDLDMFIAALPFVPMSICNLLIVLSCLGYVAWLSLPLFVLFFFTMAIGVIGFQYGKRRPLRHLRDVRGHVEELYNQFRNMIDGSRELQLNARRGRRYVEEGVTPASAKYQQSFVRYVTGHSWLINAGNAIFFVFIGVVLFLVPSVLNLPADVLATSALGMMYMMRPIMETVGAMPILQNASIALDKIRKIDNELTTFARPALAADGPDPFASPAPLRLALHDVCHGYGHDEHRFTLGPLNMQIEQGEIVFIVGGNGSGKTTLAMLLLGLYEPESGSISLNGVTVDPSTIEAYRTRFSAVFADFHLFDALMSEDRHAASAQANAYLEALEIRHKVQVVDGKFSTLNLSTGQRKRLALVASYLDDRPVYLFDEWAADQDPVFKRVFYTKLLPDLKARGKTVIAITHDDAYFHCADRLIKLADGHVETMERPAAVRAALHIA
jgi:putative ATP-binding cassette transporter